MVWLPNMIVVALLAGAFILFRTVRRNRFWTESIARLWRRRRFSLIIIGLYLAVALLDTISWVGGSASENASDVVAAHKPRSVIDRIFQPDSFMEISYSEPFADVGFYGEQPLAHPGKHILGTDILGQDVFYRSLKGVKIALLIGGLTTLIVIPIALIFGLAAGYFGGRVDDVVFFVMSTLASIPNLLLLIALIIVLGTGPVQVCVALGVTGWVGFCRLTRGETLKLREADYVQAAKALGASHLRIITRHIIPNLAHLIVITFALQFTGLVLAETVLAYLGIGLDGSWGQMIDQARNELSRSPVIWWNLAGATVLLFTLVLCVNLCADALRDILDPRTRKEAQ